MKILIIALVILSTSVMAAEPTQKRQQVLKNLLKHDCGSCHGLTLKGGLGSSLLAKDIANKSDVFLVETILKGRKGTAMPPWQAFISKQEAFWVVQKLLRRKNQEN